MYQETLIVNGEQGWRSVESAQLPPICPGFDSRTRRNVWVEFVAGSLLCSEMFFSGYPGFPFSSKPQHFQIPVLAWKVSPISARALDTFDT